MKLKCLPEDFQVEEMTGFQPDGGDYALYRLSKRELGTPEVVSAIATRWNIPRERISVGGMKDRHAVTSQHVTIAGGPQRTLAQDHFSLAYLGLASRPFVSGDISGNHFQIALRDLSADEASLAEVMLRQMEAEGVPNYFDEQRFGSLGESGEFVGVPWCKGNYERALWLAMAEPNSHDRPETRGAKRLLRERWGDWKACRHLIRQEAISPFVDQMLRRPNDFRMAIACVPQFQRSLYLAAFQSAVWNGMLALWLGRLGLSAGLAYARIGSVSMPFPMRLEAGERVKLEGEKLPLPSARLHLEEGEMRDLIHEALAPWGLTLREMRVKYPRDSFFSKGDRSVLFHPARMKLETRADELHSGQTKLVVAFDLARGAYATMVVRRLAIAISTGDAAPERDE